MKIEIEYKPSFSMLTSYLGVGEKIKAEVGAMVAQCGVRMQTGMGRKSVFRSMARIFTGESFFVNTFIGEENNAWVSLAPSLPGDIESFDISQNQDLFIQGASFLACTQTIETDTKYQGLKGLFSGESIFFIRAFTKTTPGTVYYNSYGAMKKIAVTPEHELIVDTGHLVAFTSDVDYRIGKVGGLKSLIFGGEGLVMKFRGNKGYVWVQTRNLSSLVSKIIPFLPKK